MFESAYNSSLSRRLIQSTDLFNQFLDAQSELLTLYKRHREEDQFGTSVLGSCATNSLDRMFFRKLHETFCQQRRRRRHTGSNVEQEWICADDFEEMSLVKQFYSVPTVGFYYFIFMDEFLFKYHQEDLVDYSFWTRRLKLGADQFLELCSTHVVLKLNCMISILKKICWFDWNTFVFWHSLFFDVIYKIRDIGILLDINCMVETLVDRLDYLNLCKRGDISLSRDGVLDCGGEKQYSLTFRDVYEFFEQICDLRLKIDDYFRREIDTAEDLFFNIWSLQWFNTIKYLFLMFDCVFDVDILIGVLQKQTDEEDNYIICGTVATTSASSLDVSSKTNADDDDCIYLGSSSLITNVYDPVIPSQDCNDASPVEQRQAFDDVSPKASDDSGCSVEDTTFCQRKPSKQWLFKQNESIYNERLSLLVREKEIYVYDPTSNNKYSESRECYLNKIVNGLRRMFNHGEIWDLFKLCNNGGVPLNNNMEMIWLQNVFERVSLDSISNKRTIVQPSIVASKRPRFNL